MAMPRTGVAGQLARQDVGAQGVVHHVGFHVVAQRRRPRCWRRAGRRPAAWWTTRPAPALAVHSTMTAAPAPITLWLIVRSIAEPPHVPVWSDKLVANGVNGVFAIPVRTVKTPA